MGWLMEVPLSRIEKQLDLCSKLVFDQSEGPNLKKMVKLYFLVHDLASHHMHVFEDMHETTF